MEEGTYSLVILPDEKGIQLIKEMKKLLKDKIKKFASENSIAHLTISGFKVSNERLVLIEKQIQNICDSIAPFDVVLDHFEHYPNPITFFVAPSDSSKVELLRIMKTFQSRLRITKQVKSSSPHFTIARELNEENLKIAKEIFHKTQIKFICDAVYLRRFNSEIGQYEVISRFEFKSTINQYWVQGNLFE